MRLYKKVILIIVSVILMMTVVTVPNISAQFMQSDPNLETNTYNSISSGSHHVCALNDNMELKCWGSNTFGQIGDENYEFAARSTPGSVPELELNILSFAMGSVNSCAITSSGALKCWGANHYSQIGNPSHFMWAEGLPVQVSGMESGVSQVGVGEWFACALMDSGDIYCWGVDWSQYDYQYPDENINPEPVLVEGNLNAGQLIVNGQHSCIITASGELACWGRGENGQLGNESTLNQFSPVVVEGITDVSMAALGINHTCAVGKASENDPQAMYCWGSSDNGKLGYDGGSIAGEHLLVQGLPGEFIDIAAGSQHTCAIMRENEVNSVYCWGSNEQGQLGIGTTTALDPANPITAPQYVPGSEGAVEIVAGEAQTTILKADGTIQSWGSNTEGQLGNGALFRRQLPLHMQEIDQPLINVVSGELHTCVLTETGSIYCWGGNRYGQVGNGTLAYAPYPEQIIDSGVQSIYAGFNHTCAILETKEALCWGINYGQTLGTGDLNSFSKTPQYVLGESGEYLAGFVSIHCGNGHTCALMEDGSVMCWGSNNFGQLGWPIEEYSVVTRAHVVNGLEQPAIAVSVGNGYSCAVTQANEAYCWGTNMNGELGLGYSDFDSHATPDQVVNLGGDIVDIEAGHSSTCVLDYTGGVKCWGGSSEDHTPVGIEGLESGVAAITAGGSLEYVQNHTCALMQDTQAVKCWGHNNYAQLGDGTYDFFGDSLSPVDVLGLSGNVFSVQAGAVSTCALFGSGAAACWGFDYQLETSPVDLIEVNEMDLPDPIFFSNYYEGGPESYFVITGLYFPPLQYVNILINDSVVGTIQVNETGVFKFFAYFEDVGTYDIRVQPSQTVIQSESVSRIELVNVRAAGEGQLTVGIVEDGIKRAKEGDGFTLGETIDIFLPLIIK